MTEICSIIHKCTIHGEKNYMNLDFSSPLRPIYTVRLCRMRQAYDRPTTRIVSCKSNLPLAYDCRARHEKCGRILKHVLKRCDNRSRN